MAKGNIPQRRTPIAQPSEGSTLVGQKRLAQGPDYDGQAINSELDYVHERINQVLALVPVMTGTIIGYGGTEAPNGWLLCDGAEYTASKYPELYAVIGTTYGGANGSFNVPDSDSFLVTTYISFIIKT